MLLRYPTMNPELPNVRTVIGYHVPSSEGVPANISVHISVHMFGPMSKHVSVHTDVHLSAHKST